MKISLKEGMIGALDFSGVFRITEHARCPAINVRYDPLVQSKGQMFYKVDYEKPVCYQK